eukprot:1159177-Pelagomonas_calceolata.AAC.11
MNVLGQNVCMGFEGLHAPPVWPRIRKCQGRKCQGLEGAIDQEMPRIRRCKDSELSRISRCPGLEDAKE